MCTSVLADTYASDASAITKKRTDSRLYIPSEENLGDQSDFFNVGATAEISVQSKAPTPVGIPLTHGHESYPIHKSNSRLWSRTIKVFPVRIW